MIDDPDPPRRFVFNHRWYRIAKVLGGLAILVFLATGPLTYYYGWPFEFLVGLGCLLMLAASIAIGIGLSQNWPRV